MSGAPLAIAFATIERPGLVQRLVVSARRRFPDMPIYVADQSRDVAAMLPFYERFAVRLVRMPFDAGVAAARNALVRAVADPFFALLDDDMVIAPETDVAGALAILEARPRIGVVGGLLYDIVGTRPRPRHFELYLELDRAHRLLATIPIHWFAHRSEAVGDVRFHHADAVMNFAVFRRAMFSDVVRWDERYTCNGEHEDFYLNLKVNSDWRVAYLPALVALHHHPGNMGAYEARFRRRSDGWRLFFEKWAIDQMLVNGVQVLSAADVTRGVARDAFDRSNRASEASAPPFDLAELGIAAAATGGSSTAEGSAAARLVVRYRPWRDGQMTLWYRGDGGPPTGGRFRQAIVRWFAENGDVLAEAAGPFVLDLDDRGYWRALSLDVPTGPPGGRHLRFELRLADRPEAAPLAVGYACDGATLEATLDLTALRRGADPVRAPDVSAAPPAGTAGAWTADEHLLAAAGLTILRPGSSAPPVPAVLDGWQPVAFGGRPVELPVGAEDGSSFALPGSLARGRGPAAPVAPA